MEQLSIASLEPGRHVAQAIYHLSGDVLLEPGCVLTADTIRMLGEAGIETVFRPEPGEDPGEFIRSARNLAMPVSDLKVGLRADKPVFDRTGTLLVEAGLEFTDRMVSNLRQRGIDCLYVRKTSAETKEEQARAFRQALRLATGEPPAPIPEQLEAQRLLKPEDCTPRRIDELLESGAENPTLPPASRSMLNELHQHDAQEMRTPQAKNGFLTLYDETAACTAAVMESFRHNREVDYEEVGRSTRSIVGGLIEDRDLLLNLNHAGSAYSYLATHSVTVTLLSIATAAARGYERQQVLEIAYAAYLHDIGMLRISQDITDKSGQMSSAELMQVHRHPIFSLDMLQRLVARKGGLPASIPLVAYQSHERENGSGYPKGRGGRLIHEFAKIVAACDVYHAMTCPRPWRKALLPYQAMEQIVRMGARRELDPEVVRAMLRCLSLFPIGSWVELSDGSRARVVGLVSSNYAKPVVSVMARNGERIDPPTRLNLAEHPEVEVVRAIPQPEDRSEVMDGF